MPRFRVNHRYSSNGLGPWQQADEVELQADDAAFVNRDSPGTLTEVDPHAAADRKRAQREADEHRRAVDTPVPKGTIADVLEYVDKVPSARRERIEKALAAEKAADKPRSTLVETLEQLLAAEDV